MSKNEKSLLCDVVLGFLCPPLLMGKLSMEAAEIKAKDRKPKPVGDDWGRVFDVALLAFMGVLIAYVVVAGYF